MANLVLSVLLSQSFAHGTTTDLPALAAPDATIPSNAVLPGPVSIVAPANPTATPRDPKEMSPEEAITLQTLLDQFAVARRTNKTRDLVSVTRLLRRALIKLNDRGIPAKIDILKINDRELIDFLSQTLDTGVSPAPELQTVESSKTADLRSTIDRCLVITLVACSFANGDIRPPRRPILIKAPGIHSIQIGDPPTTGGAQ